MHLKRFRWLLAILLLFFVGGAKADPINTVYVDGSAAFFVGNIGIPPYGGTLNKQSESFYCVDFSSSIKAGDSWYVNITGLSGSSFSLTRLGSQTSYLEMAWLITQMMGTTTNDQKAAYQFAIWSFTGGPNYSTNTTLVAAALAAVQHGYNGQGWEILTPTGGIGQEFLIYVPEPPQLLMFVVGLLVLGLATQKRRVAGANTT